jgi:hypothetical protein
VSEDKAPLKGGVLVIGLHAWGWGETLELAKKQFRREGGNLKHYHSTYTFGPDTEFLGVNGLGYVSWDGPDPHVERIRPPERVQ